MADLFVSSRNYPGVFRDTLVAGSTSDDSIVVENGSDITIQSGGGDDTIEAYNLKRGKIIGGEGSEFIYAEQPGWVPDNRLEKIIWRTSDGTPEYDTNGNCVVEEGGQIVYKQNGEPRYLYRMSSNEKWHEIDDYFGINLAGGNDTVSIIGGNTIVIDKKEGTTKVAAIMSTNVTVDAKDAQSTDIEHKFGDHGSIVGSQNSSNTMVVWSNNSEIYGGDNNDNISNDGDKTIIKVGQGNNTITNNGNYVTILAGIGNNVIKSNVNEGTYIEIKGSDTNTNNITLYMSKRQTIETDNTNDSIVALYTTDMNIKSDGGNDTLQMTQALRSYIDLGEGNNDITDSNGNANYLKTGTGQDTVTLINSKNITVETGKGDDLIKSTGYSRGNTYIYNVWDGNPTIEGFQENYDKIVIKPSCYTYSNPLDIPALEVGDTITTSFQSPGMLGTAYYCKRTYVYNPDLEYDEVSCLYDNTKSETIVTVLSAFEGTLLKEEPFATSNETVISSESVNNNNQIVVTQITQYDNNKAVTLVGYRDIGDSPGIITGDTISSTEGLKAPIVYTDGMTIKTPMYSEGYYNLEQTKKRKDIIGYHNYTTASVSSAAGTYYNTVYSAANDQYFYNEQLRVGEGVNIFEDSICDTIVNWSNSFTTLPGVREDIGDVTNYPIGFTSNQVIVFPVGNETITENVGSSIKPGDYNFDYGTEQNNYASSTWKTTNTFTVDSSTGQFVLPANTTIYSHDNNTGYWFEEDSGDKRFVPSDADQHTIISGSNTVNIRVGDVIAYKNSSGMTVFDTYLGQNDFQMHGYEYRQNDSDTWYNTGSEVTIIGGAFSPYQPKEEETFRIRVRGQRIWLPKVLKPIIEGKRSYDYDYLRKWYTGDRFLDSDCNVIETLQNKDLYF